MIPALDGALLFAGLEVLHGAISPRANRTAPQLAQGVNPGREGGAGLMDCDPLSKEIIKRLRCPALHRAPR